MTKKKKMHSRGEKRNIWIKLAVYFFWKFHGELPSFSSQDSSFKKNRHLLICFKAIFAFLDSDPQLWILLVDTIGDGFWNRIHTKGISAIPVHYCIKHNRIHNGKIFYTESGHFIFFVTSFNFKPVLIRIWRHLMIRTWVRYRYYCWILALLLELLLN